MSIGQEVQVAVRSTSSGVKVLRFDGTCFAGGIATRHTYRYFYGDEAEEKAHEYAENKVEEIRESKSFEKAEDVYVVPLKRRASEVRKERGLEV
jgi:hypothetical protein